MKECAICGEKLDEHAIKCSKGHSLFRPPRGRKIYRHITIKFQSCFGQILFSVFILLFGIAGIGIWYAEPVSILTCRYVETKQVDCQLQDRMVGVIPVREIPITHLKKAYVKREATTGEDEDGEEDTVSAYRVMLVSVSGEEIEFSYSATNRGASERASRRINDFLNAPTDESLTVWHAPWVAMLLGGGCFFSASAFTLFLFLFTIRDTVESFEGY